MRQQNKVAPAADAAATSEPNTDLNATSTALLDVDAYRRRCDATGEVQDFFVLLACAGLIPPERAGIRRPRRQPVGPPAAPGKNPHWVRAAVDRELTKLAAATEGHRNDTLIAVACRLFELAKAGHVDAVAARAELERIALAIGLDPSEISETLKSAWARTKPARDVPEPATIAPAYTITTEDSK